jgi:O-antigen/teichoic acid export membrane protein
MPTIDSLFHTGLRGTFYVLKRICSSLFLLCLGFLLCLLFQLGMEGENITSEDIGDFIIAFIVILFASGLLWLLFRGLHNAWVKRHFKQAKLDFLVQLEREGIISAQVVQQAKAKLG